MINDHEIKLKPYLSPTGAWAFSLGTSIGWGSLVITSSTYLSSAGPLGSVIGMILGAAVMLVISRSYNYLMVRYPDPGGAYSFAKQAYGYDHGFLTAWFLALTYFAILWANATSLPLFARYFLGDAFKFCKLYTVFDYDIYLGEALLSICAVLLFSLICACSKKLASWLMTGFVLIFTAGIAISFAAAIFKLDIGITPLFRPDSDSVSQIVKIACMSTWAFIGFENISHFTEEFSFEHKRSMRVLRVSVISSLLLYIFVTLLSVTAYPPEYSSWLEYIADLGNLSGIKGLPAFYAAEHYLGNFGVAMLMASLLGLVLSSLIGNITALSRLLFAMAKDKIIPGRLSGISKRGIPHKTVALVAAISCLVPFVGRSAIGWIVDVTTLGATLIYGIVAASAYKIAKDAANRTASRFGLVGMIVMIAFGLYLLVPNLFWNHSLEKESYFIFVIWSLLGILFFRIVLKRDKSSRFGHSMIVWVGMLSVTLFIALVWMSQSTMDATSAAMDRVRDYYMSLGGAAGDPGITESEFANIKASGAVSLAAVIILFVFAVSVLITNYATMSRRARKSEAELGEVRTVAYNDPLTGVKSKHAYVDAEDSLDLAIKTGDANMFAIVVCDVNDLKKVNDTGGHKAGDDYLREATRIICDIYKHSPVFRVGGDEFAVILRDRDYNRRDELQGKMDRHNRGVKPGKGVVIASGTSAFIPSEDESVSDVFERADALMYENKNKLKQSDNRS